MPTCNMIVRLKYLLTNAHFVNFNPIVVYFLDL